MKDLIKTKANGRRIAIMISHIVAIEESQFNSVKAATIILENSKVVVDDSYDTIIGLLDDRRDKTSIGKKV